MLFLSDDASFAIEAFDLGAVDFLLPPFTEQRINKLFDKFKKLHQNQSAYPFKQIQALLNKSHEPQIIMNQLLSKTQAEFVLLMRMK